MNGPQDLGGAHGFGPVVPDADTAPFHAPWERKAFALTIAMGTTGLWSLDRTRFMRESLPHATYYTATYYEIWLAALERLVAETGAADGLAAPQRVLRAGTVRDAMGRGGPTERPGPEPRFSVGDRVRVKPMRPATHTRAPAYVRGRVGRITRLHGCHVFPDSNAHGAGESPRPLYNIAFEARALWGDDTTAADVRLDLFEPYLEAA